MIMETKDRPLGWTTIEESLALMKAGLKPESADMYYLVIAEGEYFEEPRCGFNVDEMPCWSLGKLKSLLPREIDGCHWVTSSIAGDLASIAYLGDYGQTLCAKTRHTEIEAIVAMVLDLLNKEYM